jgi:hypothetical protein
MERSHLHCYQFVTVRDSVCSVKANEIPHIKRVLPDSHKNWEITSQDFGLKSAKAFSVRLRTLHGGRQEGVCIVDIDPGVMKISVIPARSKTNKYSRLRKITCDHPTLLLLRLNGAGEETDCLTLAVQAKLCPSRIAMER